MRFLQPWMLWALPLVVLPILIHLIHRRRHRVVEWGAMMFLLESVKMSKRMQRIREWLLLALRTLAVAGLIFGIGRPLAGGWLGELGGERPDAILVLLDRSASMSERVGGTAKLTAGIEQIREALANVQANRFGLIDSVSMKLTEFEDPADLAGLPIVGETSSQADLPGMFEVAVEHLRVSNAGRAEIWVLSDGQQKDWRPDDGRWKQIDEQLTSFEAGVRVNLLTFSDRDASNLGVRVIQAKRRSREDGVELLLDFTIRATGEAHELGDRVIPVAINLAGARSVVDVEMTAGVAEVQSHAVPLSGDDPDGWGYVELPGDVNPVDNRYYFTFGADEAMETVIVAEDDGVRDVLELASEIQVHGDAASVVTLVSPEHLDELDLALARLLIWQTQLPSGESAQRIEEFLSAGGQVLCLPAESPSDVSFQGASFGPLAELGTSGEPESPSYWKRDADWLANGEDGTELSVDALEVRGLHPVSGDLTPLASFSDGRVLLARAPTDRGGLYFLTTTPAVAKSNLANQGVVLIAMLHRALEASLVAMGSRGQVSAGELDVPFQDAELLSTLAESRLLAETLEHAGVVRQRDALIALNRDEAEDTSALLPASRLQGLTKGVETQVVRGSVKTGALVEEVWRLFLTLVLIGLVGEALLCITESSPKRSTATKEVA